MLLKKMGRSHSQAGPSPRGETPGAHIAPVPIALGKLRHRHIRQRLAHMRAGKPQMSPESGRGYDPSSLLLKDRTRLPVISVLRRLKEGSSSGAKGTGRQAPIARRPRRATLIAA
jgi:hypothetical protein